MAATSQRARTPPARSTCDYEAEGGETYESDVYTQVGDLQLRVTALEADRGQLRSQLLELKAAAAAAAAQNRSADAGSGRGAVGLCRICRLDASLEYCAVTGTRHRSTAECAQRIKEERAKYNGLTDEVLRANPSLAHVLHFCAFPPEEDGVEEAKAAAHLWLATQESVLLCFDSVDPPKESAPFYRFCSSRGLQDELKEALRRSKREARSEAG